MDPFRLRSLIAPAMASLFLMLSLCAFMVRRPASTGIQIPMIRLPEQSRNDCSDPNRIVYFRLAQDGTVWLSSTEIPTDRLTMIVEEVMENRGVGFFTWLQTLMFLMGSLWVSWIKLRRLRWFFTLRCSQINSAPDLKRTVGEHFVNSNGPRVSFRPCLQVSILHPTFGIDAGCLLSRILAMGIHNLFPVIPCR
jgi:hypothetical protein